MSDAITRHGLRESDIDMLAIAGKTIDRLGQAVIDELEAAGQSALCLRHVLDAIDIVANEIPVKPID